MPAKTIRSAMLLALIAAGCAQVPQQKPFPDYIKVPDEQLGAGAQQPMGSGPDPSDAAEISASASLLARKAQMTRSTLDLAVVTTRSRLTRLKQQIVQAKQALDESGGRRAHPEQYAALDEAQGQMNLALARTRASTSRQAATVPEQTSTVRDLGHLIASVSGVVDTISSGSTAPPAALTAEVAIAAAPSAAPPAGASPLAAQPGPAAPSGGTPAGTPPQPGPPGTVATPAVPPNTTAEADPVYARLLARAKPSRPLQTTPQATVPPADGAVGTP
ncbi:hypothetical protein KXR53_12405 [Inquilinus limosus]|uniref:hypothetical protein n=1 Tax=Inquilinus limosus TaxID=171674 RepID=UPI003F14794A